MFSKCFIMLIVICVLAVQKFYSMFSEWCKKVSAPSGLKNLTEPIVLLGFQWAWMLRWMWYMASVFRIVESRTVNFTDPQDFSLHFLQFWLLLFYNFLDEFWLCSWRNFGGLRTSVRWMEKDLDKKKVSHCDSLESKSVWNNVEIHQSGMSYNCLQCKEFCGLIHKILFWASFPHQLIFYGVSSTFKSVLLNNTGFQIYQGTKIYQPSFGIIYLK